MIYHLSNNLHMHGKILRPRVPKYLDGFDPEDAYFENSETPRVCFSETIDGALNSIFANLTPFNPVPDEIIAVYSPEKDLLEYKHKSNCDLIRDGDVFDANKTGELWILEAVKLKLYGILKIDSVSSVFMADTVQTKKGFAGKRPYYTFNYHWYVNPGIFENYERGYECE